VLREAEDKGWRVVRGSRYYKMYCPCAEKHKKTVHISPSGGSYERNLRGLLARATCWSSEEGGKHAVHD
jgi:hypothetical protein